MERSIEELYLQVKRFDEGDIYQSREYDAIARHQKELYKEMRTLFGSLIVPLLEEYTASLGDETPLRRSHFYFDCVRSGCLLLPTGHCACRFPG